MKYILTWVLIIASNGCYCQDTIPNYQFWLGIKIGTLTTVDELVNYNSYSYPNAQYSSQLTFDIRREKKPIYLSAQAAFRSLHLDLYKQVYTYDFNDGDYSRYIGHYWNYKADVFFGSLNADINLRIPGKRRFGIHMGFGGGFEKTLFRTMKNDDYILFDRERGHYYDPNQGGQVYYSHIHEEVLSTTDQLQIRRSIHSFSMRYFIRMQFRITPNQFIGTEFRILNYHTSLIGNMEGIAMRKSFDFGFSWGVALNRKK